MNETQAGSMRFYRCPLAARWLPRVLGGAILIAALCVGQRLDDVGAGERLRLVLVAGAAMIALFVVRSGGEVRLSIRPQKDGLMFRVGRARSLLSYDRIDALRYEGPFGSGGHWIPAAVLTSAEGARWRIPILLDDGGELLDELIRVSGRDDLGTWVEALGLRRKMGRVRPILLLGYTAAIAIATGGVFFYTRP